MHNDEQTFWRTMTPHRCAVLYRHYFESQTPKRRVSMEPAQEKKAQPSLYDYMTKGG